MIDSVRPSCEAKINFFDQYYTIEGDNIAKVDAFKSKVTDIAESSTSPEDFESRYAAELTTEFTNLVSTLPPKAVMPTYTVEDAAKMSAQSFVESYTDPEQRKETLAEDAKYLEGELEYAVFHEAAQKANTEIRNTPLGPLSDIANLFRRRKDN